MTAPAAAEPGVHNAHTVRWVVVVSRGALVLASQQYPSEEGARRAARGWRLAAPGARVVVQKVETVTTVAHTLVIAAGVAP